MLCIVTPGTGKSTLVVVQCDAFLSQHQIVVSKLKTLFFIVCVSNSSTVPNLTPVMSKDDPLVREEIERALRQLRDLMKGSKRSLRSWAKVIGITPTSLSEILNGRRDPRLSTYFRVVTAVKRKREEE